MASPSEEAADAFAEAAALAAQPAVDAPTRPDTAAEMLTPVESSASAITTWLLGGGVVASILIVGGLGLAVLDGGGAVEMATAPQASTNASQVVETSAPVSDDVTPMREAEGLLAADPSAQLAQKPVLDPEHKSISEEDGESAASALPAASSTAEPDSTLTTNAVEEEVGAEPAPATDGGESERPSVLRFDPLDFDPAQLTLGSATGTSNDKVSASVQQNPPDESATPVEAIDSEQDVADLPDVRAEIPSVTMRLGPIARGETNPVQVAQQFALRVESLAATGMSIDRFVAFVSDLAAVPITIDPLALELAGVSPRTAVAVQTSGVTLEELAQNGLSKQRLELVDHDGRIRLELAKGGERSTKRYDVADLMAPGAADASEIARVVERFVSPTTWQSGVGSDKLAVEGKKLRVDQTKSVHHELLIFCERWRMARGLAQRNQYLSGRLTITSPYPQVDAKLRGRTTFTFLPWTRLDDVVRHWEQSTGMTMLVDWTRLADEELAPSTPIACSAVDRPWNEALGEIFEPLGLAWWAVDSQTIQITTQDALDTIERTEFYVVSKEMRDKFDSKEAFLESLQSDLQQHVATSGQLQCNSMWTPSGRLIVRGTPAVHRYLSKQLSSHRPVVEVS